MTINEIRELSLEELEVKVNELKQELFNLKFQKTLGQLQNTAKIRDVKRTIARLKTVVTEKTGKEEDQEWKIKETKEK